MKDFTSGSLVRVLLEGMRLQGMAPPAALAAPQAGKATVPLDLKRVLIQSAVTQRGLGCLPLLGQGLKRFTHELAHRPLCSADSPQELMQRWRKLERYIHSRHRTEIVSASATSMTIRHFSLADHPPPLPAEDLVILGVLAALMEVIGAREVRATIAGAAIYPACDTSRLAQQVQGHATGVWELAWRGFEPVGAVPSSGEERTHPDGAESWSDLAREIYTGLAADPVKTLPVTRVAEMSGMSARSLQRSLAREGLSYSKLVSSARAAAACRDLLLTGHPIAEIGFACGYADQAHFTREFSKATGLTPARYRASFATSQTAC